jgi:hypothetical protein
VLEKKIDDHTTLLRGKERSMATSLRALSCSSMTPPESWSSAPSPTARFRRSGCSVTGCGPVR